MAPLPPSPKTEAWHALSSADTLLRLGSDESTGLTLQQVQARLAQYGPNRLPPAPKRHPLLRFLLQFHNPLIYVLLASAAVTVGLGHLVDASVIFGVVLINALIGFIQEGKAEAALEAVRAMLAAKAIVLREGERLEVDASALVPGDIVLLEAGSKVPADLRLLKVKNLHLNEAALTGESLPVEKRTDPVAAAAVIGDRINMAYSGTVVTYGQGKGVVVATGRATELGRIGSMVAAVEGVSTPLTRRLEQFARQITLVILVVSLITFLYGFFYGQRPPFELFLAVVGLAVAAIPEGLPAIVTITLAIGTQLMAREKAILRRLPAVESLGSVTVICTDKTGTLTRNEMTAVALLLPGQDLQVSGAGYAPEGGFFQGEAPIDPQQEAAVLELARCALLCNDARLYRSEDGNWSLVGDPTEGALITLALKAGLIPSEEQACFPRVDEIPFESERRLMATLHHDHAGHAFVLLKGAPERVLELCIAEAGGQALERAAWEARIEAAASQGQRVLALARCAMPAGTMSLTVEDLTPRFTLLGMVGMIDPPRPEAIEAVAQCQAAGIRVVMITGDHAATAQAIGRALGLKLGTPLTGERIETLDEDGLRAALKGTDVVARASPEHKLRLVQALQAEGELVAMTGDGVNDAPALKSANIGVAMGLRGTDAAKEAADLVLTDDNFATIARAVREGRRVFDNIKKSLVFILPTNGGQAGVILLAVYAGLALPITAGQILWVNMVCAVTLALALAFEAAEPGIMQRPPRPPHEPLLTRLMLARITYVSLLLVGLTFAVYEWQLARGSSLEMARTAAVNMLVLAQVAYLFNVRHFTEHALRWSTLVGNPVALGASLVLLVLQLIFTYAPPMQQLFHTAPLDALAWGVILLLALLAFFAVELEKGLLRHLNFHRL